MANARARRKRLPQSHAYVLQYFWQFRDLIEARASAFVSAAMRCMNARLGARRLNSSACGP